MQADGLTGVKEKRTRSLGGALMPLCNVFALCPLAFCILMVLNYPPEEQEAIRRQLRAALDELRMQNDIFPSLALTIALGSAERRAEKLRQSLHNARFTAMQRLVEGTGSLLEDLHSEEAGADMQPLQEAGRTLEASLEVMDTEALAKGLDKFSRAVLSARQVTGQAILDLAGALCSDYLMLARKAGLQLPDADTLYDDFMRRAQLCSTGKMLLETLSASILRSVSAALEEKRGEDTRPIRAAKQYIQENYGRPITLEQVSAVAGFNASYFSSFFKKETGQNFLEYLSEVRMNRAKELLRDSDASIAKICEMVGYLDLKHFTTTFKKMTGVQPGEFRQLYS